MKNKPKWGERQVAAVLLSVVLAANLLLPPVSWAGSVMGLPWGNLLSGAGIRWYCLHFDCGYQSALMSLVLPVVFMLGAVERSGLSALLAEWAAGGGRALTYRQRKAVLIAGIFLAAYACATLCLVFGPHPILLSATGRLYPSPFSEGLLQSVSAGVVLASFIYASLSSHLRGWRECLSVLYWGIGRYAAWLLAALLASHFHLAACYVWAGGGDLPAWA